MSSLCAIFGIHWTITVRFDCIMWTYKTLVKESLIPRLSCVYGNGARKMLLRVYRYLTSKDKRRLNQFLLILSQLQGVVYHKDDRDAKIEQ